MDMTSLDGLNNLFNAHPILSAAILIWSVVWKGFALWRSAGLRQKYWFIVILVINTLGLLDIFYIFVIARKYKVEVVEN
jgi:hypothetical protein